MSSFPVVHGMRAILIMQVKGPLPHLLLREFPHQNLPQRHLQCSQTPHRHQKDPHSQQQATRYRPRGPQEPQKGCSPGRRKRAEKIQTSPHWHQTHCSEQEQTRLSMCQWMQRGWLQGWGQRQQGQRGWRQGWGQQQQGQRGWWQGCDSWETQRHSLPSKGHRMRTPR